MQAEDLSCMAAFICYLQVAPWHGSAAIVVGNALKMEAREVL